MNHLLNTKLDEVLQLADGSKLQRFRHHPWRYIITQGIVRSGFFPAGVLREAQTFFGAQMTLLIPAAADIYLTGGKTHDSEIRLARFMLKQIKNSDTVIDIGAHFGYFTLLSSVLASDGHIFAFEPSPVNFKLLLENTRKNNIVIFNEAVSDKIGTITFYEFPARYSESNSTYADQYRREAWFQKIKYREINVACTSLDNFCTQKNIGPDFIKIDVEGAEHDVIRGGQATLRKHRPVIAMEFVCRSRHNKHHHLAKELLYDLNYRSYSITPEGGLEELTDIDGYLELLKMESDNIVFLKKDQ